MHEQAERTKEAERIYREQPVTFHIFGQLLSVGTLAALLHAAQTNGLVVRCCQGSLEAFQDASHALLQHLSMMRDT
jgi:hypothetical protein